MSSRRKSYPDPVPTWGWITIGLVVGVIIATWLVLSGTADTIASFLSNLTDALPGLLALAGLILAYLIPTFVALGTPRIAAIAVANLAFGWTIIGWILVLIWALAEMGSKKKTPPPYP